MKEAIEKANRDMHDLVNDCVGSFIMLKSKGIYPSLKKSKLKRDMNG